MTHDEDLSKTKDDQTVSEMNKVTFTLRLQNHKYVNYSKYSMFVAHVSPLIFAKNKMIIIIIIVCVSVSCIHSLLHPLGP